MYRAALRSAPRIAAPIRQSYVSAASGRRLASTASEASQNRSWKSSLVRWGLAVGAVYYYSTSAVFAEEPQLKSTQPPPEFSDEDLPTIEAVIAQKRREAEARLQKAAADESQPKTAPVSAPESAPESKPEPETAAPTTQASLETPEKQGGPAELEEEASQQGAFNPETGEINWDCPCLGGMAHGPCGEEFKSAFSCFVYSNEEPKGMDCIDKFQHMQDCFRLHPEVYGEELADDDASGNEAPTETISARTAETETAPASATAAAKSEPEPTKAARPAEEVVGRDTDKIEANPEGIKDAAPSSSTPTTSTAKPSTAE
ncbi:hypothetical protein GGR50DRAFT_679354 [Xylaria sp. CBS 124048]|nr:hypothetical protein GGR50DRAFT_679354 [Xylaria sp. CBS 124048]